MQGWEAVCWLVIGITSPKNRKVGSFLGNSVSCFLIEMKFISKLFKKFRRENESQEILHLRLFIISSYYHIIIIKNPGIQNFQNLKNGRLRFPKFRFFWVSDFHTHIFPCVPRMSLIFLIRLTFWSNKMKKYGLPEPKKSTIHELLSFRCLMTWNRDFISSIWRRKIQYYLK